MATMDPGQRGFGQQQRYNIPNLPFDVGADPLSRLRPRPRGGMRPQGPVDRLDESVGERLRGIPPELLQMLMAQLMGGQGGAERPLARRNPKMGPQMAQRMPPPGPRRATPMPTSPPRPPGGRRATPMPSGRGGRPPVIKIEDLVRALSGGGAQRQAPQANMPVPQARR